MSFQRRKTMHSDTHVRGEAQFRKDLQAAIDLRRQPGATVAAKLDTTPLGRGECRVWSEIILASCSAMDDVDGGLAGSQPPPWLWQ
jgi:hypothetical protein